MMMKCKESQHRINELVWQGLTPHLDDALLNHLANCVKCRLFYEGYSKDVTKLLSGKRLSIDNELFDSVIINVNKIDEHEPHIKIKRTVIKLAFSTIISTAAIFLGIWVGHVYLGGRPTVEKETYSQEIATLNADLSAFNTKIIEYYESENKE